MRIHMAKIKIDVNVLIGRTMKGKKEGSIKIFTFFFVNVLSQV